MYWNLTNEGIRILNFELMSCDNIPRYRCASPPLVNVSIVNDIEEPFGELPISLRQRRHRRDLTIDSLQDSSSVIADPSQI